MTHSSIEAVAEALRDPGVGVPDTLERLTRSVGASGGVVLRADHDHVIADRFFPPAGDPKTILVRSIGVRELSTDEPRDLITSVAGEIDVVVDDDWSVARAIGAPFVLGFATHLDQSVIDNLATGVEVVLARESAASRAYLRGLLEERARIASAMHEGVAQELSSVMLQIEIAEALLLTEPARAADLIGVVRSTAQQALDQLRSAIGDLMPVVPDGRDLLRDLRTFARAFAKRSGLRITVRTHGDVRLVTDVEILSLVLAFSQEAFTNVRKHGADGSVTMAVQFAPDRLCVSVRSICRDEFDVAAERSGGQGLALMRSRARLIGGDCAFERKGRRVVEVRLEVPA